MVRTHLTRHAAQSHLTEELSAKSCFYIIFSARPAKSYSIFNIVSVPSGLPTKSSALNMYDLFLVVYNSS